MTCPQCGRENPEGARFCNSCGATLQAAATAAREVRKVVTTLFCDVAGYTEVGERLDPEALRKLQSRYFDDARTVLERHGATVEKFIGDAVMAVFGVPQLHEDDALRAVRAAAELRDAVSALGLQARIGVNTGEVVTGSGDALVTGDAVNVTARLEQAAEPGTILIGDTTHRLVADAVVSEPIGPLTAKGKAEPLRAWQLLEVRAGAEAVARRLDSPMVGRDRERALLRQAFDRTVDENACHLFTVLGTAGVGKSRLVAELVRDIGGEARVLGGRCLPYGEGITFWPLYEVLDEIGDRASSVRLLLEGGASSPEEVFFSVRKLFEELARERPFVLVLDDVQWAEPTLLDFVDHVSDLSRNAPVLVVCLARPELLDERSGWGGGKLNATSVLLEPLPESDCELLLRNLLGEAELAEQTRERILQAAEGNPLFVEETLEMLIDDGLLERRNGSWVATADLVEVTVPPTIHALLAARLDRLSVEERAVVECAAVEGKLFHRGAVTVLVPEMLRPAVGGHLLSLVRKELVRPDEPEFTDEDAFRFRHLLLQEAAYGSVPKGARAELHEGFAAWLEGKAGGRRSEYEEILGYHLEQAHRYRSELGALDEALARRAAELLVTSGRRAFAAGDRYAACSLLGRATELLPRDDPVRLSVLPELGAALDETGDFPQAREILREALELAREAGDERTHGHARVALLHGRLKFESQVDAEELTREAEPLQSLFERLGDERGLAEVLLLLAELSWNAAQAVRAAALVERAREHARRAGDRRLALDASRRLVLAWAHGPMPTEEALESLDAITAGDDLLLSGYMAGSRAMLEAMLGRFDDARRSLALGLETREQLGQRVLAESARGQIGGFIEQLAGDLAAAERPLRRSFEELERLGEKAWLSTNAAQLGEVLVAQGRLDEAEELARLSEEAASPDDVISQSILWAVRAGVLAGRGDFESGERAARRAVEIAERSDFLNHQADMYVVLAGVLSLAGRTDEAAAALEEALERYEQKGNVVSAANARERLARLR
jgi:predicted ATPase/class 3 adenylate cyclase